MAEREPAEVFAPGEIIAMEIEARGWTQLDLAEILGKSLSNVSQLLTGKIGVSPETAKGLAEAFPGTTAVFWLALDAQFQLRDARAIPGTQLRAEVYSKAPVREMVRRQWIEPAKDPVVLQSRVCQFLGIRNLDETPLPFTKVASRKTTPYTETLPSQLAWLCRVKQIASAAPVTGRFSAARFDEMMASLRTLVHNESDIRRVSRVLSDHGVRFLVVEDLPGSKVDGVCVWLDKYSPVVVLSLRYGRIDSFWYTLFHELGHVKAEDGLKDTPSLDIELVEHGEGLPPPEIAANRFATEMLVSSAELDNFISCVGPSYTLQNITNFANRVRVHPAIVIGQLAHADRREITWARFRASLKNIREHVTSSTLTDGWGRVVPLQYAEVSDHG